MSRDNKGPMEGLLILLGFLSFVMFVYMLYLVLSGELTKL
jgi:hypothetical protein